MGEAVRHRGPDQSGILEQQNGSLVHFRLSIQDLSDAGRQPMHSPDGRFVVAYNGEIYNIQELREKYTAKGYVFQTRTDTEILLAMAATDQFTHLSHIHGIFAFVLWDRKEDVWYVARDRMGIKPLYRATVGNQTSFASEIPALLPLKKQWPLNRDAQSAYFTLGYVPGPHTLWEGIEAVEPGKLVVYRGGAHVATHSFAVAADIPKASSFSEAARITRTLVNQSVQAQLVSDRPVGVLLSGGLDSTAVLAAMRTARPSAEIRTFTTRFVHQSDDPKFNEDADAARKTAAQFGCQHTEVLVKPEDVIRESDAIARHLGQPHANNSTPALNAAAEAAAAQVPALLSGDGGDESFGGYERYRLHSLYEPLLRVIPLRGRTESERLRSFHAPALTRRESLFGAVVTDSGVLSHWNTLLAEMQATDPVARFMALDRATWLRDDAFVRSDRLTMRHGVELRVPLTDDTLVAFAASLPRSYHVTPRATKRLWRAAFADTLPQTGPKRGWFPPTAKWLRTGLRTWAEALLEEAIIAHPFLNGPALRQAFADHLDGRTYGLQEIQTVLSYQLWWRAYGHTLQTA